MFQKLLRLSLPLILLASPAFADEPTIDSGNTAWLLVSAALVMLMTPGLAFFYGGMVNPKNVVSTLLQNFVALALIGIAWIAVGYSLAFTEGSGFIGGLDNAMLNGLIGTTYGDTGIPYIAFAIFQMMFAIITPALITGAFAERVSFKAWLLVMLVWSLTVYVPVAHWVWGAGGWIAAKGGLDFAGGLVVHITAGAAGLVAALLWGKRTNGHSEHPYDVPMVMLGAALLWFGWFGFNAGSALTSGALAAYAFLNTFAAGAAAFIMWMVIDWARTGKPSAVGGSIGIIAGLVAITPAAGYVTVTSALIIGVIAALVCYYCALAVKKATHLDDALDVFACHGVGGIVGSVLTGVFATKAINPGIAVEGIAISGETGLFYANLVSVGAVAAYTIVMTFIIIKVVNVITPVRVSGDVEVEGLDRTIHGEHARYSLAKK